MSNGLCCLHILCCITRPWLCIYPSFSLRYFLTTNPLHLKNTHPLGPIQGSSPYKSFSESPDKANLFSLPCNDMNAFHSLPISHCIVSVFIFDSLHYETINSLRAGMWHCAFPSLEYKLLEGKNIVLLTTVSSETNSTWHVSICSVNRINASLDK